MLGGIKSDLQYRKGHASGGTSQAAARSTCDPVTGPSFAVQAGATPRRSRLVAGPRGLSGPRPSRSFSRSSGDTGRHRSRRRLGPDRQHGRPDRGNQDSDGNPLSGPGTDTRIRWYFLPGSANDMGSPGNSSDLDCRTGDEGQCSVTYVANRSGIDLICAISGGPTEVCDEYHCGTGTTMPMSPCASSSTYRPDPTPTPTPTPTPPRRPRPPRPRRPPRPDADAHPDADADADADTLRRRPRRLRRRPRRRRPRPTPTPTPDPDADAHADTHPDAHSYADSDADATPTPTPTPTPHGSRRASREPRPDAGRRDPTDPQTRRPRWRRLADPTGPAPPPRPPDEVTDVARARADRPAPLPAGPSAGSRPSRSRPTASSAQDHLGASQTRSVRDRQAGGGGGGRDGLRLPAVLMLAVLLFLLIQRRLDGRDPKLRAAPLHRARDHPAVP